MKKKEKLVFMSKEVSIGFIFVGFRVDWMGFDIRDLLFFG